MTDSYKKEKLNEVVTEYIEDGDSSIISFYQDLVGVLTESIEVNEERVNKLRGIKEIINGGIDNIVIITIISRILGIIVIYIKIINYNKL